MDLEKNLKSLMESAQEMQKKLQETQDNLKATIVYGRSAANKVQVEMDGNRMILSLDIHPSLLEDPDPTVLSGLIVAAINDAHKKVEEKARKQIQFITDGLNIGDLLKNKDKEE